MTPSKKAETVGRRAEAAGSAPSPSPEPEDTAVGELVAALNRRRLYREVTLALRSGLCDANSDFSFLRTKGLKNLLKFLRSVAASNEFIRLFRHSQTIPDLQVVPILFQNTLQLSKGNPVVTMDHILGAERMKIVSPTTDSEIAIALRILEGCCLMHSGSAALAHKYKATKVLTNILSTRGISDQGACLDALISLMLDSSSNQMDFEECHVIEKVVELIKDEQGDENIRTKCGEFLLLLAGHVNRSENSPLAGVYDYLQQALGNKCASLIWAASQFGSTLNPEERKTALMIQAGRVIESLEMDLL